ncbi:MAG: hypothetical protein ACOX3G_07370 [Armatimonadota bacterium]|jgi:cell division protein FtsL
MAAAVAAKAVKVEKTTVAYRKPKRSARSRALRKFKCQVCVLSIIVLGLAVVASPFLYANIYARVKQVSYSKSEYETKCWQAQKENERLKLLLDRYSSYSHLKDDALKLGMVPAADYDFLASRQVVASR